MGSEMCIRDRSQAIHDFLWDMVKLLYPNGASEISTYAMPLDDAITQVIEDTEDGEEGDRWRRIWHICHQGPSHHRWDSRKHYELKTVLVWWDIIQERAP